MKNKTYRFAAVAAVLLAFCLVFMAPVGAEETVVDVSTFADLKSNLEEGKSVKLVESITNKTSENNTGYLITIPQGITATLDLNGQKIEITDNTENQNAGFILVNGKLTIKDSGETGLINVTLGVENKVSSDGNNWLSTVISCQGGEVVIESGTLRYIIPENHKVLIADVVEVGTASTNKDAKLTVKDSVTLESDGVGIRAYGGSSTAITEVNIEGGEIIAKDSAIRVFQSNSLSNPYKLTISGGTISSKNSYAIYYYLMNSGGSGITTSTIISGGSLSGKGSSSGPDASGYSWFSDGAIYYLGYQWNNGNGEYISTTSHTLTIQGKDTIIKNTGDGDTVSQLMWSHSNYGETKYAYMSGPTVTISASIDGPDTVSSTNGLKAEFSVPQIGKLYEWSVGGETLEESSYTKEITFNPEKGTTQTVSVKIHLSDVLNTTVTKEVTVPAKYTVSFNANGGSGTMEGGVAYSDAQFTLPNNGFTAPSGKVFKAWNISNTEYAEGSSVTINANTEVYAVWNDETTTPVPGTEPETQTPSTNGGGKDTGSGNFAEYPRQADGTAGEIDFGSSKDVKSVDLPEGVTGAVTLVAKSNQPAPEGKDTHKVFEINIPNYPTGKPATIKFEMTLAEIEAKGLTAADVCLYHFDKETGVWTKLPTTYKVVDGKVYFEAVTTGFSPFAIVFEEGAATPAESEDEPVTPPTDEPQDVPGTDLPEIPPVDDEPETPASPAPLAAVLAALGAAVVLRRK